MDLYKTTMTKQDIRNVCLISIVASLLFIPFLGNVHLFDWDEINFAECAREMLVSGDYFKIQINFQPFWEKPPLFIWFQVLCMKIFGVNEFAARLPNALCGILSLNIIYFMGKRIYNQRFGLLWVLVYAGSILPHFYFKSGIIDPWFNLFIFLSIYYVILHTNNPVGKQAFKSAALSGLFIGLAVLTKGPAALLIFTLVVTLFWMSKRFVALTSFRFLLTFIATLLLSGFSWFLVLILSGHSDVLKEFMIYQMRLFNTKDSGHGGFLLYHFVVLLVGCFPASLFLIPAHKKFDDDTPFQRHVKRWMLLLFWVVLILFTIVKTKIVHYSSMCWLPLSFLATYAFYKILQGHYTYKKWLRYSLLVLCVLIGTAFSIIPLVDKFKYFLLQPGVIQDAFAVENIKANVQWFGYEWLIGLMFILAATFFIFYARNKKLPGLAGIFIASLVCVNLIAILVVPKIEGYTQAAAIEFYKGLKNENCYVETYGFKSYAYLFYANKHPQQNTPDLMRYAEKRGKQDALSGENDPALSFSRYSINWMMNEPIDKPVYIVSKISDEESILANNQDMKLLYRKNGFVFFLRMPSGFRP